MVQVIWRVLALILLRLSESTLYLSEWLFKVECVCLNKAEEAEGSTHE